MKTMRIRSDADSFATSAKLAGRLLDKTEGGGTTRPAAL
jgi:hypothetical protein